ncbi:hypothetical protein CsSME_00003815 [Camellia sinensis var. sinensis]
MELCLSSISSLYLYEFGGVFNELLSFFFGPLLGLCVLYVIRGTYLWNFQQKGKLQM